MTINILQDLEASINKIENLWNDNLESVKSFLSLKESEDLYWLITHLNRAANEHEEYIQQIKAYYEDIQQKVRKEYQNIEKDFEKVFKEITEKQVDISTNLLNVKDKDEARLLTYQNSHLNLAKEFWASRFKDFENGNINFENSNLPFNSKNSDIELHISLNAFYFSITNVKSTLSKLDDVYKDHKSLIEESLNYV